MAKLYSSEKTQEDISDLVAACFEALENGSKFPGMSYEEGILAAIEWLEGDMEGDPLDD